MEVVLEGVLQSFMGCFKLYEDQRQAVDEAHEIGTAVVDLAGYPKLGGQEVVVVFGVVPVDDLNFLDAFRVVYMNGDFDSIFYQPVDFSVGTGRTHGTAILSKVLDGLVKSLLGKVVIEAT